MVTSIEIDRCNQHFKFSYAYDIAGHSAGLDMYYTQLVIKEPEKNSCFDVLPDLIKDRRSDLSLEVIQCTRLSGEGGYSLIRLTDPTGVLSADIKEGMTRRSDNGECTIDRISSHQMVALVINKNCKVSRILSESGCFITSAVMEDADMIRWTVIGPDIDHIKKLTQNIAEHGFSVKREMTGRTDFSPLLSDRQEEAVREAVEQGYYDIPRKVNMGELSESLGCTKSTLNITLRNAERKIMHHHILHNRDSISKKKQ